MSPRRIRVTEFAVVIWTSINNSYGKFMRGTLFVKLGRFLNLQRSIQISWVKRNDHARIASILRGSTFTPERNHLSGRIEQLARATNKRGEQPLWSGYQEHNRHGSTRLPDDVRTASEMGSLYAFLAKELAPEVIVEFGTAFGVSGMYFLSGILGHSRGHLYTFEPNNVWARLAKQNLAQISDRFDLTEGTFEDCVDSILPADKRIDLAFIDAIHTKEFVLSQLEIVLAHSNPGVVVILDDIDFSESMRECWEQVSVDPRVVASVQLGARVGVLEF